MRNSSMQDLAVHAMTLKHCIEYILRGEDKKKHFLVLGYGLNLLVLIVSVN